jgi:hypothetical protein
MPTNKKKRIRARMAKTGESYVTAKRHVDPPPTEEKPLVEERPVAHFRDEKTGLYLDSYPPEITYDNLNDKMARAPTYATIGEGHAHYIYQKHNAPLRVREDATSFVVTMYYDFDEAAAIRDLCNVGCNEILIVRDEIGSIGGATGSRPIIASWLGSTVQSTSGKYYDSIGELQQVILYYKRLKGSLPIVAITHPKELRWEFKAGNLSWFIRVSTLVKHGNKESVLSSYFKTDEGLKALTSLWNKGFEPVTPFVETVLRTKAPTPEVNEQAVEILAKSEVARLRRVEAAARTCLEQLRTPSSTYTLRETSLECILLQAFDVQVPLQNQPPPTS